MRILIVCSGNAPHFDFQKHQAFIYDQAEALKQAEPGIQIDYFFIKGKGIMGYLSCWGKLRRQLKEQDYTCIHAHVTLSGLLANLQRKVPVVTTFHGSDINFPILRVISLVVDILSRRTIYISQNLVSKALFTGKSKSVVIPCGVDFDLFVPGNKEQSRQLLGLSPHKRYILFSSHFDNTVKNYPLARQAAELVKDPMLEILELKNYSRAEVALLFTAVDMALMTSYSEGSPQFVKEALACNCPVVSTDVGDVREIMREITGCYITTYEPADIAEKISQVLFHAKPVAARDHVLGFDNRLIAKRILDVYHQL
ncbi:D-inositol-3-phosphate glycosyltransferase [Dyadobacter sp. CECT 9275]|uniref:D-inositol-3-phosphate glycosyltransferase n=1 Tax=Dyadobacter helix TaxID=2822344 RepID=A0A916NBR2_9BACT|nr:glycosyltransferase family 4 protein [Dyadobacter sp. CECT 9275]CAG4999646.1 D-inositol-3-phosphate glycosyltransferase [Dyadobacter sp. CECT 9275]